MKKRIFILIVALLLIVPGILGFGLSPAKYEVFLEPGVTKEYTFEVTGKSQPFDVKLQTIGELSGKVVLPTDRLTIPPEGASITYQVTFPQEMRPGRHKTTIAVIEAPTERAETGAGKAPFGVRVALGHVLAVNVPYEAKYAEARIRVPNVRVGELFNFAVSITNYGSEPIENAYATIDILDPDGNTLDQVTTDSTALLPSQSEEVYSFWTAKVTEPGIYSAKATVNYDEKTTEDDASFRIGDIVMNILGFNPKNMTSGSINKFTINVENFWAEPMQGTFAEVEFLHNDTVLETVTTPQTTVDKFRPGTIEGFWDTSNKPYGEYQARVNVLYKDRKSTRTFTLELTPTMEKKSYTLYYAIGAGVVALLILYLILVIIAKKRQD